MAGRTGAGDIGPAEPPLVGEGPWRAVEVRAGQIGRPGAARAGELLVERAGMAAAETEVFVGQDEGI